MDFLPDGIAFNKNLTYLAKTNFRATEQTFGIKRRDRRQHMYVLGKSGSGKSVLLQNMIVQNIWNGEGVCVVDPHGELVETILATIPAHRLKDVVYFNPADTDYHIGFNVLQIDDPKYKHLVASGLMGIFTKIWANAWSARMEYILNNAILALVDTPGSTLLGIPRLLVDKDYRQVVVNNLKDPVIKSFWVHEYETWRDQYRNEAIAPIQNKVGQFLSTAMVRNVLGQSKSTIDLFEMMNTGKIFLVNVSKGRIGEDNSALLGGMLITKLQLAAMERVRIPEEDRKDFYLYVDEFQNFVTDSFASILSEARKYRLCLCLAHQYIAQLVTKDSDAVRDAVFGNVGTMIIFRVGASDADFLEKEFEPEFMVQDMVSLPNYHVYLKLMVDGITSRPFSAKTLPPFKIPAASNVAETIIASSRKLYARSREDVEKEINAWSGMLVGVQDEGKFKAECSSCGKIAMVPFEPEPGRPVYCKECIAKIKSGEMKPVKGVARQRIETESFDALADIGIEYVSKNPKTVNLNTSKNTNTNTAKADAPVKPKAPFNTSAPKTNNYVKPVKDRKTIDSGGLKSILQQVLVATEPRSATKTVEKTEVVKEVVQEKQTISLSSLKNPENSNSSSTNSTLLNKTASESHMSALQQAINKARNPEKEVVSEKEITVEKSVEQSVEKPSDEASLVTEVPEPVEIPKTETQTPKEPELSPVEDKKEEVKEDTKKVREIPEEILRRVLNE